MSNNVIRLKCATCDCEFQFGPHVYAGKHLARYDISVCSTCYEGNWDGWAPHLEDRVLAVLRQHGKPEPQRNAEGWLPRD